MRRVASFLLGVLIGAVIVFVSLKYHIVRANDGVHFIPKIQADFSGIYVDVREFTLTDWQEHSSVAVAIANSDKAYLVSDLTLDSLRQTGYELWNQLGN